VRSSYDIGNFTLRMVLGIIFLVHGLKKLKYMEKTIYHFHIDLGLPVFLPYAVTFIEVIGGTLLILGILTRLACIGISLVMLGAIYTVTWEKGLINGYEFDLALLAMALSLIFNSRSKKPLQ
jgi:putative oxidoreductase